MAKGKKIKVAFPHMGTISIAWAAGLKKIGVEPYVPPYTSKKTLSYGTKNSPEAICLPYKLILGNFIEAIEGGADYVAMITSPGICRLGEYGNNIQNTLKDLGYKANYIELSLYDGIKGLYNFLKEISGKNDPILIMRAINITIRKIFAIDDLDRALAYYRAREVKFGEAEKHYKKALKMIDKVDSTLDLKHVYHEALKEIEKMPSMKKYFQVLASGIASGTFGYMMGANVIESFVTFGIGCVLGTWMLLVKKYGMSKIISNIVGGVIISTLAIAAKNILNQADLRIDGMVIGSIMPLVPGLAFVNAIRDIADSDFLSGTVRMIDAILVFVYIAVGMGLTFSIYNNMLGGPLL